MDHKLTQNKVTFITYFMTKQNKQTHENNMLYTELLSVRAKMSLE